MTSWDRRKSGSRPRARASDHALNRSWSSSGTPSRSQMTPEQPGRARQRVGGQHVVVPLTAAGQEVHPRRRCHVPPRVGCALGATEVQRSRENPYPRLHAHKRGHLPRQDATLDPPEGQGRPRLGRCRPRTRRAKRANRDRENDGRGRGAAPDVAQALPDLALFPGYPLGREQLGRAHRDQRDQHGRERRR